MAMPSLTQTMLTRVDRSSTPSAPRPAKASGREVVVPAAADGHFYARFEMNGRPVEGLPPGVTAASDHATGDIHLLAGPHFRGVQFHAESILTENGFELLRGLVLDLLSP